jgi:hypothetical protein
VGKIRRDVYFIYMDVGIVGSPKRWLAASLDKTIRLRIDPPTDVRAASALAGPDWIRE